MTPSDAEKAEKPTTYQKVRPVWLWTCDNPAPCPNKAPENPVVKPGAEPPGNCPGCGAEAMRKTGKAVKGIQPIDRKTRAREPGGLSHAKLCCNSQRPRA